MKARFGRATAAALIAASMLAACASAGHPVTTQGSGLTPAEVARADSGRPPYTDADVDFLQGMIAHHAQAVRMARMAPTHGARADIRTLAERIEVSQLDEIAFMQMWLRDRGEVVPDPLADPSMAEHAQHDMTRHRAAGPGGAAQHRMPGMLTAAQLAQLDSARGPAFDRLFLTLMIQHHEGALVMVERLFGTPGAGQDVDIFRLASDINVDQITEIDRMRLMLEGMPLEDPQ